MVKSKTTKKIMTTTDRKSRTAGMARAFSLSFGKADRAARHRRRNGLRDVDSNGHSHPHPPAKSFYDSASAALEKSASHFTDAIEPMKSIAGVDVTEKVKELMGLAREQGYLTYDDIDDVLADANLTPKDLDEIHARLGNLDIEIVEQAEGERAKAAEVEEEEERSRFDSMDDPVRMYMKQM